MIVDYGGDRETSIVSAPMGAGVRVSVCFSATISVLSSGGTCGRIVEYGGDIETSTASVPTVFFFLFLCNNFCFVWRSYMCKDCGVQKVMEIRVQCPHQEEQKFVLQDFVFDFFFLRCTMQPTWLENSTLVSH
jgi:hypothetical protein